MNVDHTLSFLYLLYLYKRILIKHIMCVVSGRLNLEHLLISDVKINEILLRKLKFHKIYEFLHGNILGN